MKIDNDVRQNQPGFRFTEWELRGVPVRVELGPKDLAKSACVLARRDVPGKEGKAVRRPARPGPPTHIDALLRDIQTSLFDRAKTFRDANMRTANSYDEFKQKIEEPAASSGPTGTARARRRTRSQEETKATIRCIPFDGPKEAGQCMVTGTPSARRVVFARAY